uniref:Uncharacterized protein n=2 Tax=Timema TaxID=61471 RepID=A0A7R9H0M5_TIMPO|nr:unnamed protein product [Timema douglasi]CAD7403690.1 unnamed protein product [Timema poppensis]
MTRAEVANTPGLVLVARKGISSAMPKVTIEKLCIASETNQSSHSTKPHHHSTNMELAKDLMAEFVFCEIDRRGGRRRKLGCIQELQLLEALCDFFKPSYTSGNSDTTRNLVFMALFPPSLAERSRLLVKLVSMAISTKNVPVLAATGIWMQQLGCNSQFSLNLAEGLVKDYFVLVPKAVSGLQDLPQLAPHFTANFLTSVAEMYSSGDKRQVLNPPPNTLLEVVTQWVSDNPPLCLAALLNKMATAVTTPFVGLFKWCILSPLYYCGRTSSTEHSTLYSRLHLALLESLVRCGKPLAANGKTVISVQHVVSIVDPLIRWYKEVEKLPDGSKAVELALDRLAQAVQIGLFTGCIAGDKEELLKMLDTLPEHRVLKLVIKKQRELLTQNMDILEDDVIIVSDTSQTRMVIMSPDLPR